MGGQVQLIGVYALAADEAMVRDQAIALYGDDRDESDVARAREQLESAVLVEVLVSGVDENFRVEDFAQEDPGLPRASWQVAWAEAFLSADGEALLVPRWSPMPRGSEVFRVAFYIHGWKVGLRLLSSYGPLASVSPAVMPERLRRLVPYVLVD